jgi:parallel beta-helix repeat protein
MIRRSLMTTAVAVATMLGLAAPAFADTIVVDDDWPSPTACRGAETDSIEDAVTNRAAPGDTVLVCPGTYDEEAVSIEKNDLKVKAKEGPDETIVDGPPPPPFSPNAPGFLLNNVTGVLLEGFTVREFHDDVILDGADRNTVRGNVTTAAFGHDGISLINGSDSNRVVRNESFGNLHSTSCGISAGSGSSHNVIRGNLTYLNPNFGILLGGGLLGPAGPGNRIVHNVSTQNGFTPSMPTPVSGGAGIANIFTPHSLIAHNFVHDNKGNGIQVSGSISAGTSMFVTVEHNEVVRNGTTNENDGIVVANGATTNTVEHNESRLNRHNGIHVFNSANNSIEHNSVVENGTPTAVNGCGIDIAGATSTGNVVRHNRSSLHSRAGYRIRGGANGNTLSHNLARDNPGDGILLANGDSNTIERNRSVRNGDDGLHADIMSENNTILRNRMSRNAVFDCHDDSTGPHNPPVFVANQWINNSGETENRPGLCEPDDADDDENDDEEDDD